MKIQMQPVLQKQVTRLPMRLLRPIILGSARKDLHFVAFDPTHQCMEFSEGL